MSTTSGLKLKNIIADVFIDKEEKMVTLTENRDYCSQIKNNIRETKTVFRRIEKRQCDNSKVTDIKNAEFKVFSQ